MGAPETEKQQPVTPKLRRQMARIAYEQALEGSVNRGQGVREIALLGVRTLILVNGGAMIGLLTFLGNNSTIASGVPAIGIFAASCCFVLGLVAAMAALVVAYVVEARESANAFERAERVALLLLNGETPPPATARDIPRIHLGVISITLFGIGALAAVASVLA